MIAKLLQALLSHPYIYRLSQVLFAPGCERMLTAELKKRQSELPAPGLLLDVGCGPDSWLWKIGWHPVGLDVSYEYTEAFKQHEQPAVTGSAFQLPFLDGSFDGVWCIGVLHHLEDEQAKNTVREMLRVCRQDGYVVLQDAVLPDSLLRKPIAALIRGMDRGRNMRTRKQLESILPGDKKWHIRRYTYTLNGLEMLDCLREKKL